MPEPLYWLGTMSTQLWPTTPLRHHLFSHQHRLHQLRPFCHRLLLRQHLPPHLLWRRPLSRPLNPRQIRRWHPPKRHLVPLQRHPLAHLLPRSKCLSTQAQAIAVNRISPQSLSGESSIGAAACCMGGFGVEWCAVGWVPGFKLARQKNLRLDITKLESVWCLCVVCVGVCV